MESFTHTSSFEWASNGLRGRKNIFPHLCHFGRYPPEQWEINSASAEEDTLKPRFDINAWRFQKVDKREDELTRYLKMGLLELSVQEDADFDILEWWRGNTKEYPTLMRIAVDIFSIPAMSVEPEWAFSG